MAHPEEAPLLAFRRKFGKNDSPWVSVFNICNCAIGAGVLSLPFGFKQTGLLGGLFFTALICLIEMSTLRILVRVAEKSNSPSYQHLVRTFLGVHMEAVVSVVILILLVGGNISYFIIIGDVFTPLFAESFGENVMFGTRRVVILFFGLVVILPLSLQTTLKALKYSSMVSVIMLSYLSIALISFGIVQIVKQGFPTDVLIFEAGIQTFITLDIVVFSFQSHVQVVAIFAELSDNPNPFFGRRKDSDSLLDQEKGLDVESASKIPAKGQKSERLKRMDGIIFMAMAICFTLYTLVGEFGYIIFPEVESDVLSSFGDKNFFMNLARVGMAVVVMVCYPIQNHPSRSIMDDAIKYAAKLPASNISIVRLVLITVVFFILTIGVALITSDIGKVFSLLGSSGGVMVAFIVPGMLLFLGYHNASVANADVSTIVEKAPERPERSPSQACTQVFVGSFIVVLGVIIFMTTIYVNITDQIKGSE